VTKTCGPTTACGGGDACEPQAVRGEVREPDVVTVGGEALAFFELRGGPSGAGVAIHRARIITPRRWIVDPIEPVLELGDQGSAGAPSIRASQGIATLTDGSIELYFSDGDQSIGRAVSTSAGRSFTRDPAPILAPAEPWEAGRVGSPSVFDHGSEVMLAYEGGAGAGIGLARILAGGGLAERVSPNPVVTPATVLDPIFWRGVTSVSAPYALLTPDGSAFRLYFTARGAEGSDALSSEAASPPTSTIRSAWSRRAISSAGIVSRPVPCSRASPTCAPTWASGKPRSGSPRARRRRFISSAATPRATS